MFGVGAIFYIPRRMLNPVKPSINDLLGPSIMMLVLDMLIDNPRQWMNLREIARRIDKNPGSVSPVMPELLERGLVTGCKVGKVSVVYQLNRSNPKVKALIEFKKSLDESG
jgi:predicted DNA-binding transcriptional regulator